MKLDSALFFVTFQCPYKCPYCWQTGKREELRNAAPLPEDMSSWVDKWSAAWNRVNPDILDLTGGEPTLLDIPALLHSLNPTIKVAITTNLSNIDRVNCLCDEFNNERIVSWTLSYHPTQIDDGGRAAFWGAVGRLRGRHYGVTVNLVGHPCQLDLVEQVKSVSRRLGANFHFDPYAVPPGRKEPVYSSEQLSIIDENRRVDRVAESRGTVMCRAGSRHLVAFPDGSAYACLSDQLQGLNPVGSMLSPDFRLLDAAVKCSRISSCCGCDKDKVKGSWKVLS